MTEQDEVVRDENGRFARGWKGGPGRPKNKKLNELSESDRGKSYKLKSRFGITLYEYDEMLEKQNGVCAICGNPETKILHGKLTKLCVDHDHLTNKIRGLLCYRCNTGIGKLMDDVEVLKKAIKYLEDRL